MLLAWRLNFSPGILQAHSSIQVAPLSQPFCIVGSALEHERMCWMVVQALGVSAESDGSEPIRMESRPFGDFGGGLALSWWNILIICLGGILLLGIAARIWRKRTQRLLRYILACICRNPRYSRFKDVSPSYPNAVTEICRSFPELKSIAAQSSARIISPPKGGRSLLS